MARVFVSSTSKDLEDFRNSVGHTLRRLGHEDIAMDYYVAEDIRPMDRSLNDVALCDIYVGIFAYRYGHVPSQNNPDARSITELEYRKAQELGIPCLIFLLSDEAPWPTSKREKGPGAEKIDSLREELSGGGKHVVNFFKTADELARQVTEAIAKWTTEHGLTPRRQLTDWDVYREAVINKHQWVRMQVIAGAGKDRGPVRIPLTEIFESQLAITGASGADVPDEVRKYQEVIYGPRSATAAPNDDDAPDEVRMDQEIIYGPRSEAPASNEDTEPFGEALEPEKQDPLLLGNPEQVLDLLSRERTQIILGGPGSGKSTILHYVMLRVCQIGTAREALPSHLQDAPIPFLIDLRNYVLQKASDFPSYIVNNALDLYDASINIDNLIAVLGQERQALVLFDGLDEVFDPDERRRVINQFQSFAHRYPQARIVVTSRIAGYDRTALGLAGFEHYTLLPLTLGQIRHFAGQWYQYYTLEGTDRTAQGLVQRIVENPRLLDLAGNPLLLTMMAVIYKDRDLPNVRWELYDRCADTLIADWDLGKGIEDEDFKLVVQIRKGGKSEILQRVSMYMLEHGQKGKELNAIAYAPLLDIVATYLEEKHQCSRGDAEAIAVDILRHLMERTYVLAGIGERIFGFVHRTFMEYFAACHCKEQFNTSKSDFNWLNKQIFDARWNESEWEEVLLLLIAMLHDQKTPIREIVEHLRRKDRKKDPFKLAFAARCLGEAGDLQDVEQGKAVLEDLAQAIHVGVINSRKNFVETALKSFSSLAPLVIPPPSAVDAIISELDKSTAATSRIAAWQMGFAMQSRRQRLAYAMGALRDRDEIVRRGAIAALEREWPGRADIGEELTKVVRSDPQARVRQAALAAMQRSWKSEPAILDAISSRVDEETGHRNVIRLINYLWGTWPGNQKALELVLKLAGPMPKAREGYDYNAVMDAVVPALAGGWTGNPEALAFLREQASQHPAALIRSIALQSIAQGWAGKSGVLDFLRLRASEDSDPQTRAVALASLAERWAGDPQVLTYLENAALKDPSPPTRAATLAAIAGGWAGNANVLIFTEDRANTETEFEVKKAAFQAIASGWSKEAHAFSFLLKWAKHSEEAQIRIAAIQAIGAGWGLTEQGLDFLKGRASEDSDSTVRMSTLQVITDFLFKNIFYHPIEYELRGVYMRFLFERAVDEPELIVRESVVRNLSFLRDWVPLDYREEDELFEFLNERAKNDPDVRVRFRALETFAKARFSGAAPNLLNVYLPWIKQEATSNSDVEMRALAIELAAYVWKDAEAWMFFLKSAANDTDPRVRIAALQALATAPDADLLGGFLGFLQERVANDPDLTVRNTAQAILKSKMI